jgi:hypothetical protein
MTQILSATRAGRDGVGDNAPVIEPGGLGGGETGQSRDQGETGGGESDFHASYSFSEWGMLRATFSAASGMLTQATLSWMQRQPKNLEAQVKLLPAP